MRRNVAGQYVGAQLIAIADGTAITTGTTTVYVTGDAGTQAVGSVGSGACTHEGNGFWTYAPAQAETNYTHVAFTFVNTNAINVTVQIYPTAYDASGQMTGVSVGTGGITTASFAAGAINATAIATDAITATKVADGTIDAATFAAGAINAAAIATDAITAAKIADGAIDAATFAANAINAAALATDAVTEIQTGLATSASIAALPTAATIADAVWDEDATAHQTTGTFGQAIGDPVADTNSIYKAVVTDATAATVGLDVVDLKTQIGTAGAGLTAADDAVMTRLGTPAGASLSVDIAAIKTETASIQADTNDLQTQIGIAGAGLTAADDAVMTRLGTPAGASLSVDIAAVKTQTAAIETDTQDIQARLPAALVSGRMDASVGAMAAGTVTAAAIATDAIDSDAIAASAVTELQAGLATSASIAALNNLSTAQVNTEVDTALADIHLDHLLAVTYDPASKPGVADALLNELVESDAGVARFTANALEQAPTGGSAPTAAAIADAVWDEVLSGHLTAGSTGAALNSAGSAGDPWGTALPGAYGAGTAGKIIGDNLNATVSSRATQTSVDDLPTNAELATSQAAADDATLAAIAGLDTKIDTIDNFLDTEMPALTAEVAKIPKSDGTVTWNATALASLQQEATDALNAYDPPTQAEMNARTLPTASYATAASQTTLQTSVDDLPTNAELATALGTSDDAILALLGTPAGASVSADIAATKGDTAAIKTKTDQLVFSTANRVDSQVLGLAANSITNTAIATSAITEIQAGLATQVSVDDLPTNAELTTALAAADDATLAAIAALNNLSAVQVKTQVTDALNVDTYAEPTGVPPATATLVAKIGRLHQALRNKVDVTASKKSFYDDAGSAIWSKALADDSTTYQETKGGIP